MATTKANPIDLDDAALDRMIEQDPHKPGRRNARLADYGIPVWALIAYLQGVDEDIERTARDYRIPASAVRAAMRYHERHRELIDAYPLLQHETYES